jgi:hypothetical protein
MTPDSRYIRDSRVGSVLIRATADVESQLEKNKLQIRVDALETEINTLKQELIQIKLKLTPPNKSV